MEITHQHVHRLNFVPNYFTLPKINNLSSAKLKIILQKIENKDKEAITLREKLMDSNLLSFIFLLFDSKVDCETQNKIVLGGNQCNITANVIKCLLCFVNDEITKAESYIDKIKTESADGDLVTEAHAEMAYACLNFGWPYYNEAINKYVDVTDRSPKIYEWKYQLALTIRRCLHSNLQTNIDMDQYFSKCVILLTDIIKNVEHINLKANAHIQMACLMMPKNSTDALLQKHRYCVTGIDLSQRQQNIIDNIGRATALSSQDTWVLQESGRCLRSIKEYRAAKINLEKAIELCPSSTSYQQLALCLIKLKGYSPNVIELLQKSLKIDQFGTSRLDLGKAYMYKDHPEFTKALKCFNRYETIEDNVNGRKYNLMAICYFKMGRVFDEKYQESCRKSVLFSAICYLSTLRVTPETKIKIKDMFHEFKPQKEYTYTPKSTLLNFVYNSTSHQWQWLLEVKHACLSGTINSLIQTYIQNGQLSECLVMMILLMATDLPNIESIAIETIGEIIYKSVLKKSQDISQNCMSWTFRCFYNIEQTDCHIRIIYDDNSTTEADTMEGIMTGLGLRVIRNKTDILPFMDPYQSLLSAMCNNAVVLCIIKNNNADLLREFSVIRKLPVNKPVLIPILVDNSSIPTVLSSYRPIDYPHTTLDDEQKAIWFKTLFERIFDSFKSTTTNTTATSSDTTGYTTTSSYTAAVAISAASVD